MWTLATCRATVRRDDPDHPATNAYGDPVPGYAPVAERIPASIVERERRVWDRATQTARTVRTLVGAVGAGTDIRKGDRITDLTHGGTYVVAAVTVPRATGGRRPDIDLELTRVDD